MDKQYLSFEDLKMDIETPFMRMDDFIKLILSSDYLTVQQRPGITTNFDYDLNEKESKKFFSANVVIKAWVLKKHLSKHSDISPDFLAFLDKLISLRTEEDYLKYCDIYRNGNDSKEKKLMTRFQKLVGDHKEFDFDYVTNNWHYYRSSKLALNRKRKIDENNIKHRLYVAINYDQLPYFVSNMVSSFENKDLPYLFKVFSPGKSKHGMQNDTIVIYVDSDDLLINYVNIINNIIGANKEISDAIHTPSAHLGNIGDKIGYGASPKDNSESYTTIVGNIAFKASNEALFDTSRKFNHKFSKGQMYDIIDSGHPSEIYFYYRDAFHKYYSHFANVLYNGEFDPENVCYRKEDTTENGKGIIYV